MSLSLADHVPAGPEIYSLRLYDTELARFSLEKRSLEGLVAEPVWINEEKHHCCPWNWKPQPQAF